MFNPIDDMGTVELFTVTIDQNTLLPSVRKKFRRDKPWLPLVLRFSEVPEPVIVSKAATYQQYRVPGRSEPLRIYDSSSTTKLTFKAKVVATGGSTSYNSAAFVTRKLAGKVANRLYTKGAQYMGVAGNAISRLSNPTNPDGVSAAAKIAKACITEVKEKVQFIESLTYPQYDESGRVYSPPLVWIKYGENFNRRCLLSSFTVNYRGPYEESTLLTYVAELSMNFEEVSKKPKDFLSVYRGQEVNLSGLKATKNIWQSIGGDALSLGRSKAGL